MTNRIGGVDWTGKVLKIGLPGPSFYEGYEHAWEVEVWDAERGETRRVYYGSTMGDRLPVVVDATPEARTAANAYEARVEAEAREYRALNEAAALVRGRRVRVVRGRKVPKGTEGTLIWTGVGHWGRRVGLKTDSGEVHWTAAGNVETVAALARRAAYETREGVAA